MKRIAFLSILFFAGLYTLRPKSENPIQIDAIKSKMSAVKKLAPTEAKFSQIKLRQSAAISTNIEESLDEESHSAEVPEEYSEVDSEAAVEEGEIPWDEIKTGWRDHLRNLLSELDPLNGEDIFNAYMTENASYEAEMENLAKDDSAEGESQMGQLETHHEERLKEILGSHYQEVTDHHQQYNSSIQYLNRSSKYEVGVSL